MTSGLSIAPIRGHAGYVKASGFHQASAGEPVAEGPAGLLRKKIIAVNGAGFSTVPSVLVRADEARDAGFSICRSEGLLRAMSGGAEGALRGYGEVPLAIKPAAVMGDLSKPLYSTGMIPLSTDERSVEEAVCRAMFSASEAAGSGVFIQPAFGVLVDAGPYGKLYGPAVSGIATVGCGMETTVCAGYNAGGRQLTVAEGDERTLKEMLSQLRQSHYAQMRGKMTNLTSLSFMPPGGLDDMTLGWLFSRLRRLQEFVGSAVKAEWAAIPAGGRPLAVLLRLAGPEKEGGSREILGGRTLHGRGKRECTGLVYEYAMGAQTLRSIDSSMSGYVLVCRATNAINSGVGPQDIRNASAVVVVLDVPEKAHKAAGFCEGAAAAGKIVMEAPSTALASFEGMMDSMDGSRPGYLLANWKLIVDASDGSVRLRD
jgi:hypothetical protein